MKQVFPPFGTLIEVKKIRERSTITSAGFVQSGPPTCVSKISTGSDPPPPQIADVILEPNMVSLPSTCVHVFFFLSLETTLDTTQYGLYCFLSYKFVKIGQIQLNFSKHHGFDIFLHQILYSDY